jgi:pantetheine-phosphate adenylyltransferase
MKRALFPGTFDPVTKGHCDVLKKGLTIFDEIIIAIGTNAKKQHLFDLDTRIQWLNETFKDEPRIKVASYKGLTVDFCLKMDAKFILRGLRNASDFEYEQAIAHANKELLFEVETVFVLANPSFSSISSSIVREIIAAGGNYARFVPPSVVINDR